MTGTIYIPGQSTGFRTAMSALLAAAALAYLGYHLTIAAGPQDTNHLETPLALAVSRQVTEGPSVLYGPFSGDRPLVLIHAPLYYRIAALGAWPLRMLGCQPDLAALAAGRLVSLLGFVLSLAVVVRLVQLDGPDRWAGAWAALLVAAAPVLGSFPVTVRPDILGIFFQTLGALLALRATRHGQGRDLVAAYVAFGLAFCVKQHNVFVMVVSSVLLAAAVLGGRARLVPLIVAQAIGLGVVVGYFGMEQGLTHGEMAQSVFTLPAAFRKITPADWTHVWTVFVEVAKRSIGLLALACVCLASWPRRFRVEWLDLALVVLLVTELAATILLCRGSTGAWVNYAMQAVVFACMLTARGLARFARTPRPRWQPAAALLAALLLLAADARLVVISASHRAEGLQVMRRLLSDPRIASVAPAGLYFVGDPQHNRLYGCRDLAHDEWLYEAFETVRKAEPREVWLKAALTIGPVRVVVVPLDGRRPDDAVPGLEQRLPQLGYLPLNAIGQFRPWVRGKASPLDLARRR